MSTSQKTRAIPVTPKTSRKASAVCTFFGMPIASQARMSAAALVLALEDYKHRLARRGCPTPDGRELPPTINVGGVFAAGAGGKINTVPAEASFSIDRRVIAN